jgi:hypothetical protein
MDTSLNLPTLTSLAVAPTSVLVRFGTTKMTPIETSNKAFARTAKKPFAAQVVAARLSGTDFPQTQAKLHRQTGHCALMVSPCCPT